MSHQDMIYLMIFLCGVVAGELLIACTIFIADAMR